MEDDLRDYHYYIIVLATGFGFGLFASVLIFRLYQHLIWIN